ncbi:hypothetical protein ACSBOB_26960 [Mesorhizobium sp. ASY16-5R]|uniref:hypothetical protein n=1 Tax=Mesorhizobium sp. ASY16-5R TaxID=3445772 RepID=UPI003FA0D2DF
MDIAIIIAVTLTLLAGVAACLLDIRPTAGRVAIARVLARIALLGAAVLFGLVKR